MSFLLEKMSNRVDEQQKLNKWVFQYHPNLNTKIKNTFSYLCFPFNKKSPLLYSIHNVLTL